MLEDRHYMRRPSFRPRLSATVILLIVNIAAFVLQLLVSAFSTFPTNDYFALSVEGLRKGNRTCDGYRLSDDLDDED